MEKLEEHIMEHMADKDPKDIKVSEFKLSDFKFRNKKLKKLSEAAKRKRMDVFMQFNAYFIDVLPFIAYAKSKLDKSKPLDRLTTHFLNTKELILLNVKNKYMKKVVDGLPSGGGTSVKVLRRDAQRLADAGKVDHKGEKSIFGQIWRQVKGNNFNTLCINESGSQAWYVRLIGEGSIDAGGPYRETITNICDELQSALLPLLVPTQNNKNDHGENRDCWVPNPSSVAPTHLEMFEFFGALLGMSFRSGSVLNLNLTSFFWKQLNEEAIEYADVKGIDTYSTQCIDELKKLRKKLKPAEFEAYID